MMTFVPMRSCAWSLMAALLVACAGNGSSGGGASSSGGAASSASSSSSQAAQPETGNPAVNQVGYRVEGPKFATLRADDAQPLTWVLYQGENEIASGQTEVIGFDDTAGAAVHRIDFSAVTTEGEDFVLAVGERRSHPFAIGRGLLAPVYYDALRYFYHNRSGIEIETQYTGGGKGSYAPDAAWARPAGHVNVPPNRGDNDVPCWPGTCDYILDVPKGWYDAGDHGKYVVNGGISVWKLLNAYERAVHIDGAAGALGADDLNLPESGNGVPDLLDEARWELEFLLAMQVPEGQPLAGMAHHKMHDDRWTGAPLAPHEDPRQRYLIPPTTAATLNLAAAAAQCARVWRDFDAAFADRCLAAAERAWDAAKANPSRLHDPANCPALQDENGNALQCDSGGGGYGDSNVDDEFFWAAAELCLTTAAAEYCDEAAAHAYTRSDYAWPDTEIPGAISLAVVAADHTAALREAARTRLIALADQRLAAAEASGYDIPLGSSDFPWGSNNFLIHRLSLFALAHDFTGEDRYRAAFERGLDYLFGRNALSLSYVTGHGDQVVTQPHHRHWAGALDPSYPWAPPGALAGGANNGLQDPVAQAELADCVDRPQTCFIDDHGSWSTNEVAINWNAALVWAMAYRLALDPAP
ncbi:MAG: hypothetical protein KatS3mg121_1091 [Gammaproteobacteria bacterium]|nr:MAG: hypothetical protein KatS3mg121_1091 [Gammaproteobacteria bacterium]